jgi:hypothetical protein
MKDDVNGGHKKVRLSMWMVFNQHTRLKQIAREQGRSISDIVRQLVGEYLQGLAEQNKDAGGQ